MDLFTAQVVRKEASLDELMAGSIASIKQLFDHGHPVLVAFLRIPIVRDRSVQFDVITSSDSY